MVWPFSKSTLSVFKKKKKGDTDIKNVGIIFNSFIIHSAVKRWLIRTLLIDPPSSYSSWLPRPSPPQNCDVFNLCRVRNQDHGSAPFQFSRLRDVISCPKLSKQSREDCSEWAANSRKYQSTARMANAVCFEYYRLFTCWIVLVFLLEAFALVDARSPMVVSRMSDGDVFTNPHSDRKVKDCAKFEARCVKDLLNSCNECKCNLGNETYRFDLKRCVSSEDLDNCTGELCLYRRIESQIDAK